LRMIPHDAKSPPVRSAPLESIRWVAANVCRAEVRFEDAPSTEAYGLLQAVRQSRGHRWEFWTKMWPRLIGSEGRGKPSDATATDERDEEEDKGGGNIVEELLERYKGRKNEYVPLPGSRVGPVLPGSPRM